MQFFLNFKNTIRSVEFLICVNVPFKPLMLNNYSLSFLVATDNFLYFFVFSSLDFMVSSRQRVKPGCS